MKTEKDIVITLPCQITFHIPDTDPENQFDLNLLIKHLNTQLDPNPLHSINPLTYTLDQIATVLGLKLKNVHFEWEQIDVQDQKKLIVPPDHKYETDVHTEHCCINCGCKYSDEDCTVVTGQKPQSYKCDGYCFHW